jgi:hypothetical protein
VFGVFVLALVGLYFVAENMSGRPNSKALTGTSTAAASGPAVPQPVDASWPSTRFPASTYPKPIPASENTFGIAACPDPTGLQSVSHVDQAAAVQTLTADDPLASVRFQIRTDQAWWANSPSGIVPTSPDTVLTATTLADSHLDRLGLQTVTAACGSLTADRSFVVVSRPQGGGPALATEYLFIKRDGTLLLWFAGA